MLPLALAVLFLVFVCFVIRHIVRSRRVEEATFINTGIKVNVTKLVRRHLLSTSNVSIVDIVPQDLIETDDHPQLEILFKQSGGSKLLIKLRGSERLIIDGDPSFRLHPNTTDSKQ